VVYASLGRRALAIIVDGLLSLIVAIPLAVAGGGANSSTVTTPTGTSHNYSLHLTGIPLLLTVVIWLGYMTYMEGTSGASLGKRVAGIKVIRADGSPMDLTAAFARNLLRIVDGFAFYLVGLLFAMSSPRKQRLGDRAAGTLVVPAHVPAVPIAQSRTFSAPPPPIAVAAIPAVPPPPPPPGWPERS
jgi:uncharacterized RDD family membrane protein YckC